MIVPASLVLALGSQLFFTVAEGAPNFDPAPGCRAAITDMPGSFDACVKDEQAARARLSTEWLGFSAADRVNCAADESAGGTPSYVELLTCLEMSKAARALPKD
jgi:hypothetical protein